MGPKRGKVIRGFSSHATPALNASTFPNLKFISETNVEKYLKMVGYHSVRERAFACDDLRGFEKVV